jgi:hypothetical protein
VKVLFRDTIELSHMPLRLISEILDAVDMVITVGKQFRMIDPGLVEVRYIERVVTCPGARVDDAIWQDRVITESGV